MCVMQGCVGIGGSVEDLPIVEGQMSFVDEEDIYKIIRKEKITALIVTHDINQAISMSDKVIVLSNRPACVKNVYDIKLTNKSTPINNRKCVEFNDYFDLIWRDLDEKL